MKILFTGCTAKQTDDLAYQRAKVKRIDDSSIICDSLRKQGYIVDRKEIKPGDDLSKAILNNDDAEIIDAIGDCVVVLTNLSKLCGFKIEDCINSAYNEIQNRKGKMINGTFVKNSSISNDIEITVE